MKRKVTKRKAISLMIAALMVLGLLTACSGGDNDGGSDTEFDNPDAFDLSGGNSTVNAGGESGEPAVYLTVNFQEGKSPERYLITDVSGYWVEDDTGATVTSAYLSYWAGRLSPDTDLRFRMCMPLENNFSIATEFESYIPVASQMGDMFASAGASLTMVYTTEAGETKSVTLDNPIVSIV